MQQIILGQNSAGSNIWTETAQTVAAASGSQSVGCTGTTAFFGGISVVAFAENSPPPLPAINIVQWCAASDADSSTGCRLNNTANGNKILMVGAMQTGSPATITGNCLANGSATTCTCPSSAQVQASYSLPQGTTVITSAACYSDLASGYTTFDAQQQCTGCAQHSIVAMEVNGLSTGADSGSAAAALATTVNYTTAQANEYTLCGATDYGASPANAMVPGNSFLPSGATFFPNNTRGAGQNSTIAVGKVTVSSGSNTCSYTQTGSTNPQIVTFSILPIPVTPANNHGVIL
jgi:hypothetical protein